MPAAPHLAYMKPIPILPSSNIDLTINFFCNLLGFKCGGKHPGFVSLWTGDEARINLYFREGTDLGKGEVIVLSEVGQSALLFAHLRSHPDASTITYAPGGGDKCEAKPWGFEQFSVLDPDGNKITFASHLTDDENEPEVQATVVPDV